MNLKSILLAAAVSGGLCSTVLASASETADPTPAPAVESFSAPTPLKIVTPTRIPRRFVDTVVRVSLTIDETGCPRNVDLLSGRDPALIRHLLPAVARWKFSPAMKNGHPVSADVILPLELVDKSASERQ
ncbi:MAG TPA: energy transducer TonB [Lacunisphaera sp.]|nr:energy transducer TonB [Lacunisphaera sp.]